MMEALAAAVAAGSSISGFVPAFSASQTTQTWGGALSSGGAAFDGVVINLVIATGVNNKYSSDGISFSTPPSGKTGCDIIALDAGGFSALGFTNGVAPTTPDAINWTNRAFGLTAGLVRSAYDGGTRIVAVYSGVNSNTTALSTDSGVTWNNQTFPATVTLRDITYNGSVFCAIDSNGNSYTSATGATGSWTTHASVLSAGSWYLSANTNNGRIVTLKSTTTTFAYSDDDGATFTTGTLPVSGTWLRPIWSGVQFTAYDTGGTAFVASTSGASGWAASTLPSSGWNQAACTFGGLQLFIAGNNKSCIVTLGSIV